MILMASIAVTKHSFPAYNRVPTSSDGTTMSSLAASNEHTIVTPAKVIQPAWVRTVHWINAVAMILMIMSGWQIYNASPLFGFKFSSNITLGGWLPGGPGWPCAPVWAVMGQG